MRASVENGLTDARLHPDPRRLLATLAHGGIDRDPLTTPPEFVQRAGRRRSRWHCGAWHYATLFSIGAFYVVAQAKRDDALADLAGWATVGDVLRDSRSRFPAAWH
jgi:hypothetical protein